MINFFIIHFVFSRADIFDSGSITKGIKPWISRDIQGDPVTKVFLHVAMLLLRILAEIPGYPGISFRVIFL